MADELLMKLKNHKAEISKLLEKKSKLEGQKEQVVKSLKKEFGIETQEEATKLLVTLNGERDEVVVKIENNLKTMGNIIELSK